MFPEMDGEAAILGAEVLQQNVVWMGLLLAVSG
jgi:hypothetical protein